MTVEPFGQLFFYDRNKEWFGRVENIHPHMKVELSIAADNEEQSIEDKIELVRQLALDYDLIILGLQKLVFKSFEHTIYEKSFDEIKEMYFLVAVALKSDNKTWWLTMEPHFNVTSIYNHFRRFTMVDREIVWANFEY